MSNSLVKRVVAQELPSQEVVDAHELGVSLEEARVILALASRVLVEGKANDRYAWARAMRLIGLGMSAQLIDEDGDVIAAPLERPSRRLTCAGETAARKLGIESMDINAAWALGQDLPTSCLPLGVVLTYLEPPAWRYLAAFIAEGPDWARIRVNAATEISGQSNGFKGLSCHLDEVWKIFRNLVGLRNKFTEASLLRAANGKPSMGMPAILEAWTREPTRPKDAEIRQKAVGGTRKDTTAVPQHLLALWLHKLACQAEWGRWKPTEWPLNRNWQVLQRLALLAVLACLAPRDAHLQELWVEDVQADYRFRDGSRGPALVFRGERRMKKRGEGYFYAVRLPQSLFDILVAWLACNGRKPGEPGRIPLFPSVKRVAADDPQKFYSALSDSIAGSGCSPLIPFEEAGGSERVVGAGDRGYRPHRYRSTLKQGIDRVMNHWTRNVSVDHELSGYKGEVFSECLLDHTRDDLGYQDLRENSPDRQPMYRFEQLVAVAVEEWWKELWREGPNARRGLDVDAIEQALDRVRALEADVEMLTARQSECQRQERDLQQGGLSAPDVAEKAELLEQAAKFRNEEKRLDVETRERAGKLAEARTVLEAACEEQVLLPVSSDPGEYEARLARVLAAVNQTELPPEAKSEEPLSDELTSQDIAGLYGVTTQQVGRWRRGTSTSPLDPALWREVNRKDYRYPVSAIDAQALAAVPAANPSEVLHDIRRRRAAVGFGRRARPRA